MFQGTVQVCKILPLALFLLPKSKLKGEEARIMYVDEAEMQQVRFYNSIHYV